MVNGFMPRPLANREDKIKIFKLRQFEFTKRGGE